MSSNPNEQSCPACLEGRVGSEHETEHQLIFNCCAYNHIRRSQKFRPQFADIETETLYAFYHKNDYPLIAKLLLQCRGERTKVIRSHDLDVKSVTIKVYS